MKFDIKKRRKELDLTLEQIGDFVGVGKSTVKKWESGYIENMKRDKIALLAEVLKVSPLAIMGIDEPKDKMAKGTAERIKAMAKEKNISMTELFGRCNLSVTLMRNLSCGISIQSNSISKIADHLDCSVDYLLCRTDNPEINRSGTLLLSDNTETVSELPEIINKYNSLNTLGKSKADEYITDLSENPKYTDKKRNITIIKNSELTNARIAAFSGKELKAEHTFDEEIAIGRRLDKGK